MQAPTTQSPSFDRSAVEQAIDRICNSRSLTGKPQLIKLLQILSDHMDTQATLKPARVIAELWPDSKMKKSADLATEMNRLRKAMEIYYGNEGKNDPVIVAFPNRAAVLPDGSRERRWITVERRADKDTLAARQPPRGRFGIGLKVFAVACVVAVAVVLFLRMNVQDTHPQSARLEGSTIIVTNTEGQELWRKSFSQGFWPAYYQQGLAAHMWFGDLDGKGHRVVLLAYHPAVNPTSHSTTLICYSDHGKEKWRWTPGRALPELEGDPPTFQIDAFAILKGKSGSGSRIVVSSGHIIFYPQQIAVLNSDGHLLSEYWHSGRLYFLTLADLDGDGQDEIIASGISNGYRQATLVVLDANRVFGASSEPERPEIQIHGMGVAQERVRLLFHRSDLNQALLPYNQGEQTAWQNGRLRFSVKECQGIGCSIWYEFDNHFRLVRLEAADLFRSLHDEYYRNSKHPHTFGTEEEKQFEKVRCLVGCKTEFVPVDLGH